MLKNYFKQAWTLMRQNRLFTGIYVVGTGLSIALVMTLFIIFYVKFGPVYPEYNRDRTLVLKPIKRYPKGKPENWNIYGGVAYYVVDHSVLLTVSHSRRKMWRPRRKWPSSVSRWPSGCLPPSRE